MDRATIIAVDDDEQSLAIVERELNKRYRADYRVICRRSPAIALGDLQLCAAREQQVALIMADQWMPEMSGAEFLGEARLIDRVAMRVMLVTRGDREARQVT
jgi:thioredoxin reductase (NADPH)